MSTEQIKNRMDELAGRLNEFRIRYNRYPTHGDFKDKKIIPSRAIFYKVFSDMGEATTHAEDLWIQERFKPKKKKSRRLSAKTHQGFQCSICGNYTTDDPGEFYENLSGILIERFIWLLKFTQENYFKAVITGIRAVFGNDDERVRRALDKEGFLGAYISTDDDKEKTRCEYCGNKINKNTSPPPTSFTTILIMRFVGLLKSGSVADGSPTDGVLDCIKAVFGIENNMVYVALDKSGCLDLFEQRHSKICIN